MVEVYYTTTVTISQPEIAVSLVATMLLDVETDGLITATQREGSTVCIYKC
jgi:hypothetical protein